MPREHISPQVIDGTYTDFAIVLNLNLEPNSVRPRQACAVPGVGLEVTGLMLLLARRPVTLSPKPEVKTEGQGSGCLTVQV